VSTEPALGNSASADGMISCPKCGFVQEEGLDCKKCGIVFSKYYSIYAETRSAEPVPATDFFVPEPQDHDLRTELAELQGKIRTMNSRFAEVEFEKAERNQLRTDQKNLERQIQETAALLGGRLARCEQRLESPPLSQLHQEVFDFEIPVIHDRLEQVEDKLGGVELTSQFLSELREQQNRDSNRISELQNQISDLRREIAEIRGALQGQEPKPPVEEDVHMIRKNLDDLRQFLSGKKPD
jgi:TolA-binding protein